VREPPPDIDTDDLLATVRSAWTTDVGRVEHVPVGFGAHHWAAYVSNRPALFVTFDGLDSTRSVEELEAAYAGAVALHLAGLEFVLAPLLARTGSPIIRFGDGALSCTPWQDGKSGGGLDVAWTRRALARLHVVTPPAAIPSWKPLVAPNFADDMELRLARPWGPGPYAEPARTAICERLAALGRWTSRYHQLATHARAHDWVATHGEPHSDNQLLTSQGRYLLDWESLKLAPPERDLRVLADAGTQVDANPEMVEMFDLEWRLDEINQFAAWFAAEHHGTKDDRIAFDALLRELSGEPLRDGR
jgi:spectinomycin phosphotransferase